MKTEKEIKDEIKHIDNLLRTNNPDLGLDERGILLAREGALKWVLNKKNKKQ